MTQQHAIAIGSTLIPDPLQIDAGDVVVWQNNTATAETATSDDGGQTFTTGPIQPNANSLPISVPTSTAYTVSPAGFQSSITVNQGG
jgi:plastocyanin